MRVIDSARVQARATARTPRALNVELVGLAAASIVVLFGIALVHAAKIALPEEVAAPAAIIPLYALTSSADLNPVLTMFTSPVERQAVRTSP